MTDCLFSKIENVYTVIDLPVRYQMMDDAVPQQVEPIGVVITSAGADRSPGPASYTTRPGPLADVPGIGLHQRLPLWEDINTAPYRDLGTLVGRGRKYTFKNRHPPQEENFPGPVYVPPAFGSDSPRIGMHVRTREAPRDATPGPGCYNEKSKLGTAQKSTFHGPRDRSPPILGEGPGAPSYSVRLPGLPRIPMHVRPNPLAEDVTPGPGRYSVPASVRPNRNRGRIHDYLPRDYETVAPGAASYHAGRDLLYFTPKIPMHVRTREYEDINTAPYRNTRRPVSESPKYSMRGKYVLPPDDTPGPTYVPPMFGSKTTTNSIRPRLKPQAEDQTPGPNQYRPVTGNEVGKGDKATFHGPKDRGFGHMDGIPSGADYHPDYVAYKGRGPRFTMKGAKYDPPPAKTGEYVRLGGTNRSPRFSLKPRPPLDVSYT
jgi:hypothetical protein